MATAIGTTNTGTTVATVDTNTVDLTVYAGTLSPEAYAVDTELISAFGKAATVATAAAIKYQGAMGQLAVTILNLHDAGTWQRQIDGNTGQTYTSAKAFYSELFNRTNKDGHRIFSPLHKLMRDELTSILVDEDGKLAGIGTNELAELIGCSPAQVTRSVQKAAEQKALEASVPVDLDKVYTDAVAAALESGADEKAAAHAGEAARAEAKAAASSPVVVSEEDKAAQAAKDAAKELSDADKAGRTLVKAIAGTHDAYHLMNDDRRAEVRKELTDLLSAITAFDKGTAKATTSKRASTPKPGGQRASA